MKASGHSDPPSRKEYIKGQRSTAPTPQQNHAALYLRVSTPDQKPDLQYDGLRAYAERAGLTIVGEYCDIAVSGRREGRPRLNALMTRARNRELDCVLVWKFDRFARSTRHLLTALEEFDHLGVRFISLQGQGAALGQWATETRDVAQDFATLFADELPTGAPLPHVRSVLIGADSDNTASRSTGWLAGLHWVPAAAPI